MRGCERSFYSICKDNMSCYCGGSSGKEGGDMLRYSLRPCTLLEGKTKTKSRAYQLIRMVGCKGI